MHGLSDRPSCTRRTSHLHPYRGLHPPYLVQVWMSPTLTLLMCSLGVSDTNVFEGEVQDASSLFVNRRSFLAEFSDVFISGDGRYAIPYTRCEVLGPVGVVSNVCGDSGWKEEFALFEMYDIYLQIHENFAVDALETIAVNETVVDMTQINVQNYYHFIAEYLPKYKIVYSCLSHSQAAQSIDDVQSYGGPAGSSECALDAARQGCIALCHTRRR